MSRGPGAVALLVLASALGSFASFASKSALGGEAAAPTVVVLNLAPSDEVTTEAMARVKGELAAAGFEVVVVAFSGDDALHALELAGRERNAVAAFAIFVRPFEAGTSVAEIWVSDRIRQKVVIQNAVLHETDRGRGSEILAVRAVEVLKANLANLWTQSPPTPPPDPAPAAQEPPPALPARVDAQKNPRAPFASGPGVGLGAGLVEAFAASGPTWSPEAMASYGGSDGLSVRATFAGLGPAVTFSATSGSAEVERQLALLEAVKTWWPRAAVVPFVMAGSGAQHVHVAGAGNAPYQGHTASGWSLLTEVGAGTAIPIVSTLSLVVQVRGLAAWPSTAVQIAGAEVGRIGGPSLLVDGGLFGTLP